MSIRSLLTSKRVVAATAIPAALLASGGMVMASSYSAFSSTTANPANSWAAGTVQIDNDASTALFSATNLKPGATESKCLTVKSTGSLASSVKLYATDVSQTKGLGDHLKVTVEEGNANATCASFSGTTVVNAKTLSAFGNDNKSFATGVGAWTPAGASSGSPVNRAYRITYVLDAGVPNTAQGGTASAGFTWEAQNS